MNRARLALAAAGAVLLLMLAACAPALPSYDTVREETRSAMQLVVDQLPAGTEVEDDSTEEPYGCSQDGVMYTGHWVAFPGDDFDGPGFIDAIPSALGDEWTVDEDAVLPSGPAVNLESDQVSLSIAVVDDDGAVAVDILGISQCGELVEG